MDSIKKNRESRFGRAPERLFSRKTARSVKKTEKSAEKPCFSGKMCLQFAKRSVIIVNGLFSRKE